jgi:hypothetical protein
MHSVRLPRLLQRRSAEQLVRKGVRGDVRRVPEPHYEHADCAPVEREVGYAAHQVRERVALLAAALGALRLPEHLRVPARGGLAGAAVKRALCRRQRQHTSLAK